jgi:4-amino-4-deoxy-L-arabinose transferase-like glycosyltransferase
MAPTMTGHSAPPSGTVARDLLWLVGLALLVIAAGLGLRDPWPADEPRFALIARDMVESGRWLVPMVGGDYYPDKPPLYFWIMAACYALTGSLRIAFLLPSLLSALATLVLVYDLVRRLWHREAALAAGLLLLFTVAFTWQARAAQIDMTVTAFITLSLYGLLRHLLVERSWVWYTLAGFAAGLGVITKGVGFVALLALIPFAVLKWRGWSMPTGSGGWRWVLAPAAMFAAIALWLVPMLMAVAASHDPRLLGYRNDILFQQTVTRYAEPWHHVKPVYFYIVEVIPGQWLPLSLLLIWLVPRWRRAWSERDAKVWLPLCWALLVVIFFSMSGGKRSVYILPAVPAVVIAAAPYLRELWQRRGPQIAGLALTLLTGAIAAATYFYLTVSALEKAAELLDNSGAVPLHVLLAIAVTALLAAIICRVRAGFAAFAFTLGSIWLFMGWVIAPAINGKRSSADFVAAAMAKAPPSHELGLVAYKEQFLLYVDRPTVNFGHRRWREGAQESYDAARWLNLRPKRALLVDENQLALCFQSGSSREFVGESAGMRWFWVIAPASPQCAAQGRNSAIYYQFGHLPARD